MNAFTAALYQKEWSRATARSKSFWTAGVQETGKWTCPSFSWVSAGASWACAGFS